LAIRIHPHWPFVALALGACSAASAPTDTKAGTLGNGSFSYDCLDARDPSCANASTLDQGTFPSAIAFGGRFGLTYTAAQPTTYPNVSVQPVSSAFFASDDNTFGAIRVGTPWFVAFTQEGTVLDLTSVTVAPIASVQVTDTTPAPAPDVAGTTHTFGATAQGALGQPLAGEVLYTWSSSDPSIAAIQSTNGSTSPSSTVSVLLEQGGTATLTAWTSTTQGSITVDVQAP
jgi:hypothetical protein